MKPFTIRLLLFSVAGVAGCFALFLTLSHVVIPLLVWLSPTFNPTLYDLGLYGAYPSRSYLSNDLTTPRVTRIRSDPSCERGFVFLTVNGDSVERGGPMILDYNNEIIWKGEGYQATTNLKVQNYQSKQYLTFWSGHKAGTLGRGVYYMLDDSYNIVHEVSAVGANLYGDLHEFKITKDDTALMTIYNVTRADLSSLGKRKHGWLTDSVFQEVDIATGELLFEWRASEHFEVTETFMTNPLGGWFQSMPFDFFHINSVDKDSKGNYLISSRHTHTITCINPDGQLMWILGGQRNQFKDLSRGQATDFRWQHDARWVSEEEGILTLFDNKEGGPLHVDGPYSRGMMLQLDIANRTVTLLHEYVSEQQTRAPSQGSTQMLPDIDHVFIGWGHSPVFSEFAKDGSLLCESHFGASLIHAWGGVVSYRAFKSADWVGRPREPPTATILDQTLFVSWNGATEVAAWILQGAGKGEPEDDFVDLDIIDKESFEESFDLSSLLGYSRYRVGALDRNGQLLAYSEVAPSQISGSWWSFSLAAFIWGVIARLVWMCYTRLAQRKNQKGGVGWTS